MYVTKVPSTVGRRGEGCSCMFILHLVNQPCYSQHHSLDEIESTVSTVWILVSCRRLAWGCYLEPGKPRLTFSVQEDLPLEALQAPLKASLSAGVVIDPKVTTAGGPTPESDPSASSGTLATLGHHVAFGTRNQSKRVCV